MNIYLISQTVNQDYDTYDSAVVVAESEEAASKMHPAYGVKANKYWAETWSEVENVTVV